jgi:hypothetical protein
VGLLALLLVGCGGSSGPVAPSELDGISIVGETLVPAGARTCHVGGTVVNARTDLTVDVTMRWHALDASAQEIGFTKVRVLGVGPGTQQDFESTGFASNDRGLIGCGDIVRFERIETGILTR